MVIRRFLSVLFLIALSTPGQSQEVDLTPFYPLEEGSVREYLMWEGGTWFFHRQTVRGDTTIAGESYALIDIVERDTDLNVLGEERCATRPDDEGPGIQWLSVEGDCEPFSGEASMDTLSFSTTTPTDVEVWVGGEIYDVQTLSGGVFIEYGVSGYSYTFVSGVGLQKWVRWEGPNRSVRASLSYAEVGGVTYGTPAGEYPDWESFVPFAVGDTWVYDNVVDQGGPPSYHTTTRLSIVGDTLIDGTFFVVAEEVHYDPDTEAVVAQGHYALRRLETSIELLPFQPLDEFPYDSVWELFDRAQIDYSYPGLLHRDMSFTVGDVAYEADVLRSGYEGECGAAERIFAKDIGVVRWYEAAYNCGPSGGQGSDTVTLLAARVGGTEYGDVSLLSTAPTPDGGARVELYPNPFRSTIFLRLDLPVTGPSTVEVFDVLGRRVLRRDLGVQPAESEHRLNLADVPAGLYVVRVSNGSESTTERLVKVR